MARLARVLSANTAFHVTQRGNARQLVFENDSDHLVYLDLLQTACVLHAVSVVGYCLMSNHVHLIAVPTRPESLPLALKDTHGRYAAYFNARRASSGHVWQGRYYSCPLDDQHLWAALRYTELNPVRASIVGDAVEYRWSTAAVHCGVAAPDPFLEKEIFPAAWTSDRWRRYLDRGDSDEEIAAIRACTHTGRPLGSVEFVSGLEQALRRRLAPGRGGRPAKERPDERQAELF